MHFADELVEQSSFDFPALKEQVAPAELKVAKMLIDSMSTDAFEPEKFHDQYREAVMTMIDARVAGEEVSAPEAKRSAPTNVVNLMDVLQRSLEQSKKGGTVAAPASAKTAAHKPAATSAKKSASAAKPKRKKKAA